MNTDERAGPTPVDGDVIRYSRKRVLILAIGFPALLLGSGCMIVLPLRLEDPGHWFYRPWMFVALGSVVFIGLLVLSIAGIFWPGFRRELDAQFIHPWRHKRRLVIGADRVQVLEDTGNVIAQIPYANLSEFVNRKLWKIGEVVGIRLNDPERSDTFWPWKHPKIGEDLFGHLMLPDEFSKPDREIRDRIGARLKAFREQHESIGKEAGVEGITNG